MYSCSVKNVCVLSSSFLFMSPPAQEEETDDDGETYEDLDERWWDNVLFDLFIPKLNTPH